VAVSGVVIEGTVATDTESDSITVLAGQAALGRAGEWVRYSTPHADGARYVAVGVPAFSPEAFHRDEGADPDDSPLEPSGR